MSVWNVQQDRYQCLLHSVPMAVFVYLVLMMITSATVLSACYNLHSRKLTEFNAFQITEYGMKYSQQYSY
jgi:hypothetical protein